MGMMGGGGSPLPLDAFIGQGGFPSPGMGSPGRDPGAESGGEMPSDPTEILRQAIEMVKEYLNTEKDDEDLAAASKVIAALQSILAKQQKETDAAVGITPQSKYMRRLS